MGNKENIDLQTSYAELGKFIASKTNYDFRISFCDGEDYNKFFELYNKATFNEIYETYDAPYEKAECNKSSKLERTIVQTIEIMNPEYSFCSRSCAYLKSGYCHLKEYSESSKQKRNTEKLLQTAFDEFIRTDYCFSNFDYHNICSYKEHLMKP